VKHSVQRLNKVLFGQKALFETVAMTAHFPTLCSKKAAKSALLIKKVKKRTARRSTSFGKSAPKIRTF